MAAQTAILVFRDYTGQAIMSGITQGQDEGTHKHLHGANDFNGRGPAPERCDLLAPFDCKVMAIATADNAVFFQSTGPVMTPVGTFNSVWFMCVHALDTDMKNLGIKVGKVFRQGEPCYTEGTKGIGAGPHIHMEQGFGTFGGGSLPYYKSGDTYIWNGKRYYQYYPNVAAGGAECPVTDIFFKGRNLKQYQSEAEKAMGHPYYSGKWKTYGEETADPGQSDETIKDDAQVIELRMALTEAKNALKTKEEENKQLMANIGQMAERIANARKALED